MEIFDIICEELKAKMVSITVKQSANVINAEQVWNIKFLRKGSHQYR